MADVLSHDSMRKHIIESSRKVFMRFGFKRTTIDDIAEAISKGRSLIYYYFNNKEDIFNEIIREEGVAFINNMEKEIEQGKNASDMIKIYLLSRRKGLQNIGVYYDVLRNDYYRHFKLIEKARRNFDNSELKLIKNILTRGIGGKEFQISDIEVAASTILSFLKGLEYSWTFEKTNSNRQSSEIEFMVRTLFYGIIKR